MGQEQEVDIVLERSESSINWGFRLHNFGKSGVAIQLVYDESIAEAAGLDIADRLVKVGDTDVEGLTLLETKKLVSQQGDYLRLTVRKRGGSAAIRRPPPKKPESQSSGRASWYDPAAKEATPPQERPVARLPHQASEPASESPPVQRRENSWRHEVPAQRATAPPQRPSRLAYEAATTEETIAWPRPASHGALQPLEPPQSDRAGSSEAVSAQRDVILRAGALPKGVNSALAPRGEGRNAKRLSGGPSLDGQDHPPRSPVLGNAASFDSLPRGSRLSRGSAVEDDEDGSHVLPAYQRHIVMRGLSGSLSRGRSSGTPSPTGENRGSAESLPKNSSLQIRLSRGSAVEEDTQRCVVMSGSLPRNVNSALAPRGEGRSAKRLSGGSFTDDGVRGSGLHSEARTSARLSSGSPNDELASLPPYQRELAARLDALTASEGPPPPKVTTAVEEDWSSKPGDHFPLPAYQKDWRNLGKGSPTRSPRSVSPQPLPPAQITVGHAPGEVFSCDLCQQAINGPFVRILNKYRVHSECVRCHTCGRCLRDDTRVVVEGRLFCEPHALEAGQPPEPGLVPMIIFPEEED